MQKKRFISLVNGEPFDYTKWQRNLWNNKSGEEISRMAMESCNQDPAGPPRYLKFSTKQRTILSREALHER